MRKGERKDKKLAEGWFLRFWESEEIVLLPLLRDALPLFICLLLIAAADVPGINQGKRAVAHQSSIST